MLKDMFNREFRVGDLVCYSVRMGSSTTMVLARVDAFVESTTWEGKPVTRLRVARLAEDGVKWEYWIDENGRRVMTICHHNPGLPSWSKVGKLVTLNKLERVVIIRDPELEQMYPREVAGVN